MSAATPRQLQIGRPNIAVVRGSIAYSSNNEDIDGILRMLSQDVKVQLDEVTSLIVTSKAVVKFPRQLVTKMTKLKDNYRQQLIELVCPPTALLLKLMMHI